MSIRQYYLGPWVWDDRSDPTFPHYRAPEGTIGLIDLRGADLANGLGFFATDRLILDRDYLAFGDGINRLEDVVLNAAQRAVWASALGIGPIVGNRLVDALWETLTLHGDPDRGTLCKPLMPTHHGALELRLGGHNLIRTERFNGEAHASFTKVQAVIQRDYRSIRGDAYQRWDQRGEPPDIHCRYLECMRRKTRIDWAKLIPPDLPQEPPRRPATTYTESFNQADSGTLGPDLTWSEVLGSLETRSSRAHCVNDGEDCIARAEHDLSTDDHESEFDFYLAGAGGSGRRSYSVVRFSASALTGYVHRTRTNDESALYRYDAGTPTGLTSTVTVSINEGDRVGARIDASTLSSLLEGSVVDSVIDTNLTGQLRCGLGIRRGSSVGDNSADEFACTDLVAPAGILKHMLQYHG